MATTLRPITPDDEPFLFDVYAASRSDELAQVPWNDEQKRTFLAFQFDAQHRHYRDTFAGATFHVVLDEGIPAGRLYVDRRADEIRILDIALLPEHRGRGIGTRLLRALLAEAAAAGKPVGIFVEHYRPRVLRLFERLGFAQQEDHGLAVFMVWRPEVPG